MQSSYIISVINGPTLWVTKFTFSLLYLQIFRPMRWLRICIYLGATLFTVFYWSLSIALFILSSLRPGETCAEVQVSSRLIDTTKLAIPVAAGGLVVDVWLFILPLVAIYKLQLHTTRKIRLTVIFSTDLMLVFNERDVRSLTLLCRAVAASAVSIYYRYKIAHTKDKTWLILDVDLL